MYCNETQGTFFATCVLNSEFTIKYLCAARSYTLHCCSGTLKSRHIVTPLLSSCVAAKVTCAMTLRPFRASLNRGASQSPLSRFGASTDVLQVDSQHEGDSLLGYCAMQS
jgi:hypothetical protein